MIIYYEPGSGEIRYTIDGSPEIIPPGSYIVVPDGTKITPTAAFRVQNGVLVESFLDPCKEQAIAEINCLTGITRKKYITVIPGQDMLYKEKEIQAVNYLAASPEPNTVSGWETEYPSIAREVGITADTPANVATVIVHLADIWRDIGSLLDQFRLGAILTVENATDRTAIDQAVSNFQTAVEQF